MTQTSDRFLTVNCKLPSLLSEIELMMLWYDKKEVLQHCCCLKNDSHGETRKLDTVIGRYTGRRIELWPSNIQNINICSSFLLYCHFTKQYCLTETVFTLWVSRCIRRISTAIILLLCQGFLTVKNCYEFLTFQDKARLLKSPFKVPKGT